MSDPQPERRIDYDPVFLNARREAIVIFCIWLACLIWSVPYCYLNGYPEQFDASEFKTFFGVPSWLFWGIALPWILANVATTWFCFFYMSDDDLGVAEDEAPLEPESQHRVEEQGS